MNKTQRRLMDLASELGRKNPQIDVRTYCPWCDEFTLFLAEHKERYKCLKCERAGSIDEVEQKLYGDIMSERRGVKL